MGRRKNLAQIDRLNGNPGKRKQEAGIGVEAEGKVLIFDHLHEDAQACVEVIVRSMPPGVYAAADSFLLSAFATAWTVHKHAAFAISDPAFEHLITNAAGNLVPNPMISIVNVQARILASLGDRLGLDPKARAVLKLPGEQSKSKFDGLLGSATSPRRLNS